MAKGHSINRIESYCPGIGSEAESNCRHDRFLQ